MISDEYKKTLNKILDSNIKKAKVGFNIKESCRDYIFPILVHCMENINIFNEEQLENINQISNKLIYG